MNQTRRNAARKRRRKRTHNCTWQDLIRSSPTHAYPSEYICSRCRTRYMRDLGLMRSIDHDRKYVRTYV